MSSAGTSGLTGWDMDERAAAQLVAHGGDPEGFSARRLTAALIAESDLVLTATREHRGKVATMYPKVLRRLFTFRDFADIADGMDRLSDSVLSDSVLSDSAAAADPRARVRQVTEQTAARRGLNPPLEPVDADIVDPFGREDEVFATMARQIVESMPVVVRALAG